MNSHSAFTAINTMAICIYLGHLIRWLVLRWAARCATDRLARSVPPRPRSRAATFAVAAIIGTAVGIAYCALASASPCGSERAAVKLGLDQDARAVNTRPIDTTIAALVALPRPAHARPDRRSPAEMTVYRVHGTLTVVKLETDGDYHLVISDSDGHHMIVEIPAAECAARGVWAAQIAAAREAAERVLHPGKGLRRVAVPVMVTGVGFFDVLHGQVGVARNGIELHPVLSIEIGGGS